MMVRVGREQINASVDSRLAVMQIADDFRITGIAEIRLDSASPPGTHLYLCMLPCCASLLVICQ
jgi:hypothetical protein